jgi:hypothetical protein
MNVQPSRLCISSAASFDRSHNRTLEVYCLVTSNDSTHESERGSCCTAQHGKSTQPAINTHVQLLFCDWHALRIRCTAVNAVTVGSNPAS